MQQQSITIRQMTDEERLKYGPPSDKNQPEKTNKLKAVSPSSNQNRVLGNDTRLATAEQIYAIQEMAAELKLNISDITGMAFDEAHELKEKLSARLIEMRRVQGHIWTEDEVRGRLKHYNDDDSLYYAKVTRPKLVVAFGSGADTDDRIIKKIDLDRGIEGALRPFGKRKPVTKDHKRKERLYWLIKLIYVCDMGFTISAKMLKVPRKTLYDQEAEAVGLITGYLNGKITSGDKDLKG